MRLKNLAKNFLNGIVSAINAVGFIGIAERIARVIGGCDPKSDDLCNKHIILGTASAAVSLSWLDYAIQWLPVFTGSKDLLINKVWNVCTDVSMMWNFYLHASLAFYISIYGEEKEVDDRWETPLILTATCFLAMMSNARFRDLISANCTERNRQLLSGFFGLFRGFAGGRIFIETIERAIEASSGSVEAVSSTGGMAARFMVGGACSLATSYMSYKYSPNYATEDLFPKRYRSNVGTAISVMNGLFSAVTFAILNGENISKMAENDKKGFSVGFLLLIPAVLLRNCCERDQDDFDDIIVMDVSHLKRNMRHNPLAENLLPQNMRYHASPVFLSNSRNNIWKEHTSAKEPKEASKSKASIISYPRSY